MPSVLHGRAPRSTSPWRWNLFSSDWVRWLIRERWFLGGLQTAATVVLAAVAWCSWGGPHGPREGTHAGAWVAIVVWKVFWPALVLTTVMLGRVWCAVCPLELIARSARALGRVLRAPTVSLPWWVDGAWTLSLTFAAATFALEGLDASESSRLPPVLLLAVTGTAATTGLLLRNPRAFCKLFCPGAAMLSSYARCSPLTLGPASAQRCDECEGRHCVRSGRPGRATRGCAALLGPFRRTESDGCLLCLRCVQSCPSENLAWGLGAGEARADRWRLRLCEGLFVLAAAGLLMRDLAGTSPMVESILGSLPRRVAQRLPSVRGSWFAAAFYLLVFPTLLGIGLVGLARLRDRSAGRLGSFLAVCGGALPIVALGHSMLSLKDLKDGITGMVALATQPAVGPSEGWADGPNLSLSITGARILAFGALIVIIAIAAVVWRGRRRSVAAPLTGERVGLAAMTALMALPLATVRIPSSKASIVYGFQPSVAVGRASLSPLAPGRESECRLVWASQRGGQACRGDWNCGGVETRSLLCRPAGEAGLLCSCVVNEETVVAGTADTCGVEGDDLVAVARRLCGWRSLPGANRSSFSLPGGARSRRHGVGIVAD